jgi:Domain of unknown function (DUF4915)
VFCESDRDSDNALTFASVCRKHVRFGRRAVSDGVLWAVNARFSCLCSLDRSASFAPPWRPPFVTVLEPTDRCHLNGLAMEGGRHGAGRRPLSYPGVCGRIWPRARIDKLCRVTPTIRLLALPFPT